MSKKCQKPYCEMNAIKRGKYCDIHRTNKKVKKTEVNLDLANIRIQDDVKVAEDLLRKETLEFDRVLKTEQDEEYEKTMEADRIRLDNIEIEKAIKASKDKYFEDVKNRLDNEVIPKEFYNIKIQFPNGTKIHRKFNIESTIRNIREYIDVYLYESNSKTVNYELVLNFLNKKFTCKDIDLYIKDISSVKTFIMYLSDLDA